MVGSDRALALNAERAGSLASHGKACNRFVAHFNAFTRIAIVPNLVPCITIMGLSPPVLKKRAKRSERSGTRGAVIKETGVRHQWGGSICMMF